MPDPSDNQPSKVLDFNFFRALARDILRANAEPDRLSSDIEDLLSEAFRDTFESGLASGLSGLVTAIQAVEVPRAGFVRFAVPDSLTEAQVRVLREQIMGVSRALHSRCGYQPVLVLLPESIKLDVVAFVPAEGPAEHEAPGTLDRVMSDPSAPVPGRPSGGWRPALIDLPTLKGRVVEVVAPKSAPLDLFPTGQSFMAGVTTHQLKLVLGRDEFVEEAMEHDGPFNTLDALFQTYAAEVGVALTVAVVPEGPLPADGLFRFDDGTCVKVPVVIDVQPG